ncbi:hypothetical protein KAI65_05960 [Candidatus Parcubacteria bacterium]|nr:hypothetical protein [Candidatus Parcubacteria bacterium]
MSDIEKIKRMMKLEIEEEELVTTIKVIEKTLKDLKEKCRTIKTKKEMYKK